MAEMAEMAEIAVLDPAFEHAFYLMLPMGLLRKQRESTSGIRVMG
jgi:hypothetical protein